MSEDRCKTEGRFLQLWRWVKRQVVQDVPKDIAVCEFDCRKEQCRMGEWESCDRRINEAAGEPSSPLIKSDPSS